MSDRISSWRSVGIGVACGGLCFWVSAWASSCDFVGARSLSRGGFSDTCCGDERVADRPSGCWALDEFALCDESSLLGDCSASDLGRAGRGLSTKVFGVTVMVTDRLSRRPHRAFMVEAMRRVPRSVK